MKSEWTDEQVYNIEECIKHWQWNVDTLVRWDREGMEIRVGSFLGSMYWFVGVDMVYFDGRHCKLCEVYSEGRMWKCVKCPLSDDENRCNLPDSPWMKCAKAEGNKVIIKAAQGMLNILKGLIRGEAE